MRRFQFPLIGLGLALLVAPVRAQGVFDMGMLTNTLGMDVLRQSEEKRAGHTKDRPGGHRRPAPDRSASRSFAYRVTPTLKKQAMANFLAKMNAKSPAAAKMVQAQFAKTDYDRTYRSATASFGLRSNDVADVLAAYMVLGWMISTNHTSDPPRAAVRGVRAQLARLMARQGAFSSPALRAREGEQYKIVFVTVLAGWGDARKKGTSASFSDQIASTFVQQNRTDLRRLTLGLNGFRLKS